jgi:hypothetical protein
MADSMGQRQVRQMAPAAPSNLVQVHDEQMAAVSSEVGRAVASPGVHRPAHQVVLPPRPRPPLDSLKWSDDSQAAERAREHGQAVAQAVINGGAT